MTRRRRVRRRWPSTTPRASRRSWCAAPVARKATCRTPASASPGQPFHGADARARRRRSWPSSDRWSWPSRRGSSASTTSRCSAIATPAWPETPTNEHPDSFHQADIDEATGRLVAVIRRAAPAGDPHLRRRPAGLPAPRPPAGARHLGAGVRPGRRSRLVSRARRAVPARRSSTTRCGRGPGCWPCTRR